MYYRRVELATFFGADRGGFSARSSLVSYGSGSTGYITSRASLWRGDARWTCVQQQFDLMVEVYR